MYTNPENPEISIVQLLGAILEPVLLPESRGKLESIDIDSYLLFSSRWLKYFLWTKTKRSITYSSKRRLGIVK